MKWKNTFTEPDWIFAVCLKLKTFKLRYNRIINIEISINRDYWPNIRSFYNQKKPEFSNNNSNTNLMRKKSWAKHTNENIELSIIIIIFGKNWMIPIFISKSNKAKCTKFHVTVYTELNRKKKTRQYRKYKMCLLHFRMSFYHLRIEIDEIIATSSLSNKHTCNVCVEHYLTINLVLFVESNI